MFAPRYFSTRYWQGFYWSPLGASTSIPIGFIKIESIEASISNLERLTAKPSHVPLVSRISNLKDVEAKES